MQTFLVVGLGNPEKKYTNTWHNLGFEVIDKLKKDLAASDWKDEKKFHSQFSECLSGEIKIILAKPLTYMNKSGEAILALSKFYKISPENILVIHDELDLPVNTIRISKNGSHAGNNGIRSIIDSLGTAEFPRLRLGIGPRQDLSIPAEKYVLQKISAKDKITISQLIDHSAKAAKTIIDEGIQKAMNQFN